MSICKLFKITFLIKNLKCHISFIFPRLLPATFFTASRLFPKNTVPNVDMSSVSMSSTREMPFTTNCLYSFSFISNENALSILCWPCSCAPHGRSNCTRTDEFIWIFHYSLHFTKEKTCVPTHFGAWTTTAALKAVCDSSHKKQFARPSFPKYCFAYTARHLFAYFWISKERCDSVISEGFPSTRFDRGERNPFYS